jgi:hypothetical protein
VCKRIFSLRDVVEAMFHQGRSLGDHVGPPDNMGMSLVSRSKGLGAASEVAVNVDESTTMGRIAFTTEQGSFVVSLPGELVAVVAANIEELRVKTAN